jgi:hypothetical protein
MGEEGGGKALAVSYNICVHVNVCVCLSAEKNYKIHLYFKANCNYD